MQAQSAGAYPKLNDPGWVDRNQRLSAQELQGLAADFTKLHVQELTHGKSFAQTLHVCYWCDVCQRQAVPMVNLFQPSCNH